MELFDLTGRTALVTGSSLGIGFALARGLAQAGARIVLNARDAGRLAEAAQVLRGEGFAVDTLVFDVTDAAAVKAAVDGYERERPIDILINNAGMQHRGPLEDFEVDAFDRLMRTNVNSAFYVGQAVGRHMIARGARADHQYRLCADSFGAARHRTLHRVKGGDCEPDKGDGDRLGQARSELQRDRARLFRHAVECGAGGGCRL